MLEDAAAEKQGGATQRHVLRQRNAKHGLGTKGQHITPPPPPALTRAKPGVSNTQRGTKSKSPGTHCCNSSALFGGGLNRIMSVLHRDMFSNREMQSMGWEQKVSAPTPLLIRKGNPFPGSFLVQLQKLVSFTAEQKKHVRCCIILGFQDLYQALT
jgi:hypothetical protein